MRKTQATVVKPIQIDVFIVWYIFKDMYVKVKPRVQTPHAPAETLSARTQSYIIHD